jgi:TetR/AcrR family transcriptional repressor of nem operon
MARAPGRTSDTAERVLDVAERLAQTRGFNGFSYADIAAEVGITTASLHYHFPTKADLGEALVVRYTDAFQAALTEVAASSDGALTKLERYVRIYHDVLGADRMCLCGMFAAEYATLPAPMQQALRRFFDDNERWLVEVLETGRADGSVQFEGGAADMAGLLTGALEGSMLLARSYSDVARFGASAEQLLRTLRPTPGAARSSRPVRR